MQFQAQIQIHLRPSVLDPAGAAVQSSLHQLGHTQVQQVRIGKHIQLQLEAPTPRPPTARWMSCAINCWPTR
jgi:phosphoribosylformylglycinamidine synthase PurS subunit